jgi:hypothetical protein
MEAEIIDLQRWKKAHPPAIVLLIAGLTAACITFDTSARPIFASTGLGWLSSQSAM